MIPSRTGSSLGDRRQSVGGSIAGRTSLGPGGRASLGAGGRMSLGAGGRTSLGAGARQSLVGASGIPRVQSRIASARSTTTQPQYDFLTGGEAQSTQPLRERGAPSENENAPSNSDHDRLVAELRAEVKTLKYTISTREQEQELTKLRQESELRDARRKADEDFKKMQQAEGERNKATRQRESLMKELQEIKDRAANEKAALERRMREAEEARRVAVEEVEDGRAEMEDRIRGLERGRQELESRNAALKQSIEELRRESEEKDQVLQEAQQGLELKDEQMGNLESEILRLKAQSGDAETLGVIKRELSEQVAHIRTLEATNREQLAELKHFRRLHKSVEVVEEEKRVLQQKVDQMDDLQQELAEARLQRQRLEDERLAWTAYLQSQAGGDSEPEFDSPEAVARALVMARLESASLIEKAGRKEAEVAEKEDIIKTLESEKSKLESQLKKAKGSDSDDKVRLRLERQRALALKEVEYLRAQLKTFDQEESTMELQSYDEAKAKRIQELEDMVTQYRTEVQTVSAELAATPKRNIAPLSSVPAANGKRSRDESDAPAVDQEQLGVLSRKNRKLQDELSAAQTKIAGLQKEVSVLKERLEALTSHAQTRVLELRNNPTAQHEAIKRSTLTSLKDENQALLEQLRNKGKPGTAAVVPLATLERAQRDVSEAALQVADKEKTIRRLKEIWGAKTTEFREGVRSLLGWKVDFLPNGKMRVSSLFLPSSEDGENSIVFDGELGTMKISGGPQSAFARKIRDQIKFWVTERGEIPCLLAQLTLEFYEETTRAARH